jgi:penicillin amidase
MALSLVVVGLVVAGVSAVRAPLPETEGTLTLDGLEGEVTVLRDDAGIPQVYADSAADLFFAQGFVQAQDRFFEMDVRRHITAGRLSEMFGEDSLEIDQAVRTMGWRRVAEEEVAALDPESLSYLESLSAGVNANLADTTPGDLALEYTLLGLTGLDYQVEDWTPVDSVAWLKAMAWDLRGNMEDEIDRAMASTALTQEQIADLYPPYPYDRNAPIVDDDQLRASQVQPNPPLMPAGASARLAPGQEVVKVLERTRAVGEALPQTVGSGEGVGSNSWVVDGEHSKTGAPILANDPHLAPTLPGVWYQMGLHCTELSSDCPFDVSGFTFAGYPGVIIGHNQRIAWGFTNLGPDVTDLYLEAIEGERYLRGDRWRPLQRRTETIEIAGEEPFTFTVRSSLHGPLISDVSEDYSSVGANAPVPAGAAEPARGTGYAVALSWTALEPSETATSVFALNRAQNWDEFRAAARKFAVPSQNMVYADVDGHIGYQAPGRVPIRRPGHTGEYPAPGWDRSYDWTGRYIPYDQMPSLLDPREGFIATANQAVTGPRYRFDFGGGQEYGQRSQRIREELEQRGTLSVADMTDIQMDSFDEFATVLVPYLLDVDTGSRYYADGQELLADWDFTHDADSAAAAYYNAVWARVLERTFADELPDSVPIRGGNRWFEVVRSILDDPTNEWWDDTTTEEVREARDDVLRGALQDGRDDLVRLQSRRTGGWTWGHQHTLTLRNQTLGTSGIGPVESLLNRGDWEVSGSISVLNATGWDAEGGFEVDWVPSMRMVVPMDDLDGATWINLTGASGHAFSEHYTDQTDLWVAAETRAWPFTPAAVDEATEARLTLEPGSGP